VDPTPFDKAVNPVVSCWFRESAAAHPFAGVPAHLALLDRYGVGRVERRSPDPGVILYADDVQVVVRPHRSPGPPRPVHPRTAIQQEHAELESGRWKAVAPD
jgi:hypothetical protein